MRIFIGLADIASQISDLKKGFSELGLETYAAIIDSHIIRANQVDEVITKDNFLSRLPLRPYRLRPFIRYGFRCRRLLKEMAKKYDVFIFVWQSFYDDIRDFEYLKSLGKKIVVIFMGSEQRWQAAYDQEMALYNIPSYFSRYD